MTGNASPDDRILTDTTRKGSNMYVHACTFITSINHVQYVQNMYFKANLHRKT